MKNKSGRHRSTNRFKFVTFTERVNSIDIRKSALYRIEHVNADKPEENETYFYNTITRWKVLNLTTEYINFTKSVGNIVTLPQLILKKDEITTLLIKNLELQNNLTLQPLLELVVALAKDLQDDFYPYFSKFLDCLVKLLDTKDPEQLEWTLICIAFLFKALKVYLKRDITIVFKSILPLLSNSTKWYIRNFATESFAFIARDVKEKKKFIEKLVKIVQADGDAIIGCGHLFFEVLRGVGNQFHSGASTFLQLYFETFKDSSVDGKTLFTILTQTIGDMLEFIDSKNGELFWNTIIESVNSLFESDKGEEMVWAVNSDEQILEYLLLFIGQALEYSQGKFLCNPMPILNLLHKLMNLKSSERICEVISNIGILILLCQHINLPHENAVSFVKKVISIPYSKIVSTFVQEVVSCTSFDMIVFPHFIDSITEFNSDVVKALSRICVKKSPLCKNGSDVYSWVKYPMDFGFKWNKCYEYLKMVINRNVEEFSICPDDCINVLICLPHMKHIDVVEIKAILKLLISNLIHRLRTFDSVEENLSSIRNIMFCLALSVESSIHIIKPENVDDVCFTLELLNALLPYVNDHRFICSLRILDVIFTIQESEHLLNDEILEIIHPKLEENLLSPFHEMRLLSAHIYSLFETIVNDSLQNMCIKEKNIQDTKSSKIESFRIFSLCYSIEKLPLSVESYREQLLKLSKMTHNTIQYGMIQNTKYKNFPLKYMLGLLSVNFKLLWEPTENLILTFANGLQANEFWEIFYPCLQKSIENVRNPIDIIDGNEGFSGTLDSLRSVYGEYYNIEDKPDWILYRLHLLEILHQASNICNVKNKDITTLFLDFMKIEFNRPQFVNIYETSMEVDNENVIENDEEFEDEDDVEKSTVNRTTYDALIAFLKVYNNAQNPKSFYKEQVLHAIYYDFLMHKNPIIQQAALDCLLKYKNKHIAPYKERLCNLIDGKKFKEELRTFKLESDSECIHVNDRDEVMPVILRIAFSKMITNMGVDKKGGSQMRKSLVMRFLSGCTEDELVIFVDMAFKIFVDYIDLSTEDMCKKMENTYSTLTNLSPKRLFGCLNLLENMREQFIKPGESKLLSKLLKIIFCIGSFVKNVLKEQDKLRVGYVGILKNIRNNCIQSVSNFFKQLDQWMWNEKDLLYIFDIFIWPIIDKLPIEGIHSPTALLKLFNIWSQIPRYHVIFNISSADKSTTVLPFLLKLIGNAKINHSVNDVCMSIIERLFTLECGDESIINLSSEVTFDIDEDVICKLNLSENLNVGSRILIPYISAIVTIMKNKFGTINPKKLQKRDLTILSRTTELVYDPQCVDTLLQFSLPILIHKISVADVEENLEISIEALTRLLSKTSSPKKHILNIIPLFSKVSTARARKLLCESLKFLANHCDTETVKVLSNTADIVAEMNASDEKWIEQPDFERRLAVYKRIYKMLEEESINIELACLIMHNCFFTIANSNDISLRGSAVDCLQKIVPKLMITYKEVDFFIQDTVLHLIKNGLKSDNDLLRIETIGFLGELVRECPDVVGVFNELYPLTNKQNREIDFFENLQHLQVHRKTRALIKFCSYVKTLKKAPTPRTLMQFVFPLASQYICNDKYIDKNSLVEAAIDTIVVICRLVPWRHYEMILKQYLNKLHRSTDHQKQLIKLISCILDAFHFDLSKAGNIEQISSELIMNTDEKAKEENTMEVDEMKIDDDNEIKESDNDCEVVAFERIQILSPSGAKRVIHIITNDILLKLNWSSSQIGEHEASHKSLHKGNSLQRETEEKLRIPMGFAIVKLLQKLPQPMLDNNILSILIKIIHFLKSPLVNVRIMAREIIAKIMVAIGSKYLNMLLTHMTTLLTRGIHVHILILTVHTVLEALEDKFRPGEMDDYFENISKICLNDLFGHAAEEKEVAKLANKAPETKPSKKCYLTLRVIAQNISEKCIVNFLGPFKNVLETTISKKTVLKVQTCFQHISAGLANNNNVSFESLLIFICGVLSESVPKLSAEKKVALEPVYLEEKRPKKVNCLLIAPDPKGSKKMPKKQQARMSLQANAYIIVEFGLNLTYVTLQKDKLNTIDCRPYLDPMIPFILDGLKSSNVNTTSLSLRIINSIWAKKISLPTLKQRIEDALTHIFNILHKYSTSGLSKKDENFHIVSNSFKAMTTFIRDVKYHTLSIEQTKSLLMYAEHDIHNFEKQATAFLLLKAILAAKYDLPEIKDVIRKVVNITITNESPRAREESSQVLMTYLMNYSNAKIIKQNIEFYIKQLEYEMENGRISAIKILQSMIDLFPLDTLVVHGSFMYISLGMRIVSEASSECKNLIIKCIEKLIQRLSSNKRNEIFNLTLVLFNDVKPIHTEIAAQLLTRYIIVEGEEFKSRIGSILPKIVEKLSGESSVGRFVKLKKVNEDNLSDESKDCQYIEVLRLLDNLCRTCPSIFTDEIHMHYIDNIGSSCQELLAYSHALVRLGAVDFLTLYIKSLNNTEFKEVIQGKLETERHFCYTIDSLKSLSLDLCSQLLPGSIPKELASATCKALSTLLEVVSGISFTNENSDDSDDFIDCVWIAKKIKSAVNSEVAKSPSCFIIRFAVFEMLEELTSLLNKKHLLGVTMVLMSCLLREMSRADVNFENLRNKAIEVGSLLNNKLGSIEYNEIVSKAQMKLAHKRKERKLKIAQDKVQNPERAAKRKLILKDKKREYKKRKIDKMKGKIPRKIVSTNAISMDED